MSSTRSWRCPAAEVEIAERILEDKVELAARTTSSMEMRHPDLFVRYGDKGRTRCREDTAYHLEYLSAALDVSDPSVFADYVSWLVSVLTSRGIPTADIALNFEVLSDLLKDRYGTAVQGAVDLLSAGIASLDTAG